MRCSCYQHLKAACITITLSNLPSLGRFLGSVEVNGFKGNEIICDAMKEVYSITLFLGKGVLQVLGAELDTRIVIVQGRECQTSLGIQLLQLTV